MSPVLGQKVKIRGSGVLTSVKVEQSTTAVTELGDLVFPTTDWTDAGFAVETSDGSGNSASGTTLIRVTEAGRYDVRGKVSLYGLSATPGNIEFLIRGETDHPNVEQSAAQLVANAAGIYAQAIIELVADEAIYLRCPIGSGSVTFWAGFFTVIKI